MDRLAALMANQLGVVSRAQALERGLKRGAIGRRVACGEWRLMHPGVYRLAAAPTSWRQRAMAALLAAGSGAALSHFSAGYLLDLSTLNEHAPETIDVTVPRARRLELRGIRSHRPLELATSFRLRVDFAWPERKVALHVDSAAWHSQSQRLTRDAIQRNQLQALGWYSSVVTHAMLQNDAWLETLNRALDVRSPQRTLDLGCIGLP